MGGVRKANVEFSFFLSAKSLTINARLAIDEKEKKSRIRDENNAQYRINTRGAINLASISARATWLPLSFLRGEDASTREK